MNNEKGTEAVRLMYKNDTQKMDKAKSIDQKGIITSNRKSSETPPEPINILIPEGFRDALSMDTKTQARLCVNFVVNQPCALPYEANIKGLITKIPGFLFMSYR